MLELPVYQRFEETLGTRRERTISIVDLCRKILFLQEDKIHWDAHIWYLERFHFESERIDRSSPVVALSFIEVTHKRNRELLKQYMRYGLGITYLTIKNLRSEMYYVKNLLMELPQEETVDICSVTPEQMDTYFRHKQNKEIQARNIQQNGYEYQTFFSIFTGPKIHKEDAILRGLLLEKKTYQSIMTGCGTECFQRNPAKVIPIPGNSTSDVSAPVVRWVASQ